MGNDKSLVDSTYSEAYGHHRLILKDGVARVQKTYNCASQEEKTSLLNLLKIMSELDIPTIIKIMDIIDQPSNVLIVHYEYCSMTVEQLIQRQKSIYSKLSESDLYIFIDCVLSGLMALSFKNLHHRDLRPATILIGTSMEAGRKTIFKIGYPLLMNTQTAEKRYSSGFKQCYFSPQLFQAVSRLSNKPYSQEKNDVFSLGLIAVEIATLEPIDSIFDHRSGLVNYQEIDKKLKSSREAYSDSVTKLMDHMLSLDGSSRPNFSQVFQKLQPLLTLPEQEKVFSQIVQTSTSLRKIMVTSNKKRQKSTQKSPQSSKIQKQLSPYRLSAEKVSPQKSRFPRFCVVTCPSILSEIHIPLDY